jgi:hypothetical protein
MQLHGCGPTAASSGRMATAARAATGGEA